jgi:glycine dehydrogenase subunit 1
MRSTAELCLKKARYAADKLTGGGSLQMAFDRPVFKEFTVRATDGRVEELLARVEEDGIFAGVPLGDWYPELHDCFLVAVTEKRTKEEIDRLVEAVSYEQ